MNENHQHVQGWNPNTTTSFTFLGGGSLLLSSLLCLPNVSNKYYHYTRQDQMYAQQKED